MLVVMVDLVGSMNWLLVVVEVAMSTEMGMVVIIDLIIMMSVVAAYSSG